MTSDQVGRQIASGRGFTVLELLMVLAIGAVITAIAIPNVDQAMKTYRADLAAQTCSGLLSIATTWLPAVRKRSVSAPSPHPRSRMRSPGCGASKSATGSPSSETNRACAAYVSGSQRWVMGL